VAVAAGVTFVDTAPAYTSRDRPALGEELIGQVIGPSARRGEVVVATKGGHWRHGDDFPIDARPVVLHRQCRESLVRLGVDAIDLYLLHWPDPAVPLEESVGTLGELREQGLVRMVGVCNVDLEQLERARAVTDIDAVQNRFSPLDGSDRAVLDACAAEGTAYLAYSPLGGPAGSQSIAAQLPRFAAAAERASVSVQEICFAWLLAQAPNLVPIAGAGSPASIAAAAHATTIELAPPVLEELDADRVTAMRAQISAR
jgi:pyridoxine 4-dehydrogenase